MKERGKIGRKLIIEVDIEKSCCVVLTFSGKLSKPTWPSFSSFHNFQVLFNCKSDYGEHDIHLGERLTEREKDGFCCNEDARKKIDHWECPTPPTKV